MSWNHKLLISISRQFQLQPKIFLLVLPLILSILAMMMSITNCSSLLEERTIVLGLASVSSAILFSTVAFLIADSIRRLPDLGRAIAKNNLEWVRDRTNILELEVPIAAHYQTISLIEALTRLDAVNQKLEERIADLNRELHSAKAAIETANQVKSNFLSEMSHELRTPLNAILGMTQIMQQEPETTRSQQADIDLIHCNSQHLVTAIDNMLMRSRLGARQTCLEPKAIQACLAAESVIEPTALQIMPQEWLIELERAASELDEDSIRGLLDLIPDEHSLSIEALHDKVNNFDFGDITDLVRQIISEQ